MVKFPETGTLLPFLEQKLHSLKELLSQIQLHILCCQGAQPFTNIVFTVAFKMSVPNHVTVTYSKSFTKDP
jgi:hypothetical protein